MAQNVEKDQAAIESLFYETPVGPESFAVGFLTAVPLEKIHAILQSTREQIGPVVAVEPLGGSYRVRSATHEMDVQIMLDSDGRITGLLLQPPWRWRVRWRTFSMNSRRCPAKSPTW